MATDMLTVQEPNDLRLGILKTSVDDWRTMVGRLEKPATGGDVQVSAKDLRKKANAADWVGVNATVARQFVTRTAAQFDDAVSEAKSVLAILSDAHAAFTQHKQDLRTAIDELAKRSIYANGNGSVIASAPPSRGRGKGRHPRADDQELEVAQRRITRILREATETDRAGPATGVMRCGLPRHPFGIRQGSRRATPFCWRLRCGQGPVDGLLDGSGFRTAHAGNASASRPRDPPRPEHQRTPGQRLPDLGFQWSRLRDSNPRPTHYECVALAI